MDYLLGSIILWPVPWVPEGFALCDGTLLNLSQNQALYSLFGTLYGGNGTSNFGLPDFRGKVAVGTTTANAVALTSGSATVNVAATGTGAITIATANLPAHSHALTGATVSIAIPVNSTGGSNTDTPGTTTVLTRGTVQGGPVNTTSKQYTAAAADTTLLPFNASLSGANTGNTGSGAPLPFAVNVPVSINPAQPGLSVNFIICTSGVYPTRQ